MVLRQMRMALLVRVVLKKRVMLAEEEQVWMVRMLQKK
jgi:hypothetical protein